MRYSAATRLALLCVALAALLIQAPAAPLSPLAIDLPRNETEVDVELVIAIDISYSMDLDELALQRDGYAEAIVSREFLDALKSGIHGKVAITYVEWAGSHDQRIAVPWRLIEGPASADAFAAEILAAPLRRSYRTSISGALLFSAPLFKGNQYQGFRQVIDVSGDGTNNQGTLVTEARDDVLRQGIIINGLPLMLKRPNAAMIDIENLDIYYEDCVVGGPGSFVIPIRERDKFKEAIRTKLVLEIAGRAPEIIPAAATGPRVSCTIGERMWQQRWGNGIDVR